MASTPREIRVDVRTGDPRDDDEPRDDEARERHRREQAEHQTRICERLGIDPAETRSIRLEILPRGRVLVEWTGLRRVPLADVADLLS